MIYRDGKVGTSYIKRFNVTGVTRDREVDLTMGTPGTRVLYFTANPNGEAEVIKVTLDASAQTSRRSSIFLERDFADVAIKGRGAKGITLTKKPIHRIGLKSHGHSTLGGRKVWYDPDVNRLNYDEHGRLLGEFYDDEQLLVILDNGEYYLTNFDVNNHFEDNLRIIEKYNPNKVWTAVLFDADNGNLPYMKRFQMDATTRRQNFLGDNPKSQLIALTDVAYPRFEITFKEPDTFRGPQEIDAEEFIAVKGFKAKGKRITTLQLDQCTELEPTRFPEPEEEPEETETTDEPDTPDTSEPTDAPAAPDSPDDKSDDEIRDELTGQLRLF
jgi:topoisomerase-4 subunit A